MARRLHAFLWSMFFAGFSAGTLAAGTSWWVYTRAGSIYDSSIPAEELPAVDVIVCLAGARGRISLASDFWYRYWIKSRSQSAPTLFLSGTGRTANWGVITQQVGPDTLRFLKLENVVIENESVNTLENATFFREYALEKNWKRILLVTSSYHVRRAEHIFSKILPKETVIHTRAVQQSPYTLDKWTTDLASIRITVVEYLKWKYYEWLL